MKYSLSLCTSFLILFSACSDTKHENLNTTNLDSDLSQLIVDNNLTGDPVNGRSIPSIESEKSQLGMQLFFSKSLGGDRDAACVTCHHPMLGGGDNLSLPIGVGAVEVDLLGEGRLHDSGTVNYDDGLAPVPRNAPSTFNMALWDKVLFWDGRVETIADGIRTPDSAFGVPDPDAGANLSVAQARFPVTSHEEMRGFVFEVGNSNADLRTNLGKRLSDDTRSDYIPNTWQAEFEGVYGADSVNMSNIADAIGEYENSQLFVNTPWKNYIDGNTTALSEEAKRGAKLFYSSYEDGGVSCVSCHSGDFFTDEKFHVMAVPQVGHGKGDGVTSDDDFGREREDSNRASRYSFRTPTLLNVEMTGPWGHSGAYVTLEDMVSHMVNVDAAVAGYDVSLLDANVKVVNTTANTQLALDQLNANKLIGKSAHENVSLSTSELTDLVSFLKALTDPCLKSRECVEKWIPDNTLSGPDSLRQNGVDQAGNLL